MATWGEAPYTLVTSTPSDWAGDYVIVGQVASSSTYYVLDASGTVTGTDLGSTSGAKTFTDAGITLDGSTLTGVSSDYVYTCGKTGSNYYLKMKNSSNYLTYASKGLTTSASSSDATAQWTLTASSGTVTMTNCNATDYTLLFNTSSKQFRCYNSSNNYKLYFYKLG